MQAPTEIDGEGRGAGEDRESCTTLQSSRLQSPTWLQSPQRLKRETNPAMASSLSGLSQWADKTPGMDSSYLFPTYDAGSRVTSLRRRSRNLSMYIACNVFEKGNVC